MCNIADCGEDPVALDDAACLWCSEHDGVGLLPTRKLLSLQEVAENGAPVPSEAYECHWEHDGGVPCPHCELKSESDSTEWPGSKDEPYALCCSACKTRMIYTAEDENIGGWDCPRCGEFCPYERPEDEDDEEPEATTRTVGRCACYRYHERFKRLGTRCSCDCGHVVTKGGS